MSLIFFRASVRWATAALPILLLVCLHIVAEPSRQFHFATFHEVAIAGSLAVSSFLAYMAHRGWRETHNIFLWYVSLGYLAFGLLYLPHGLLTRTAAHNTPLFIVFGPVARMAMSGSLLLGLLRVTGKNADRSASARPPPASLWKIAALLIAADAAIGAIVLASRASLETIRALEWVAAALSLGAATRLLLLRSPTGLMRFHLLAQLFFVQASAAFLTSSPWNAVWWYAHGVSMAGFLLLGYALVQAQDTGSSLGEVYDATLFYKEKVDALARANDGLQREINERKQAEEALRMQQVRFRELADAMPQLVWTAAPDGTADYFNQRWLDYIDTNAALSSGRDWSSIVHPDDCPDALAKWTDCLRTRTPFSFECRLRRQDGSYRWHLTRVVPVRGSQDDVVRWYGTCTDIEEQRRIYEDAQRANRIKDEFLVTVSHELRTPLHVIMGCSQLLAIEDPQSEPFKQSIDAIMRNAKAQSVIIDALLDISRIISGKLHLDAKAVDLAAVVRDALAAVKLSADAKSVSLVAELDDSVGPVTGDSARLQQVLWNILANAIKFTPQGGRVVVSLRRAQAKAQVKVVDDGEGINSTFLPFVFDRFSQEDSSKTRQHGGLGLGLAVVRYLIEAHGGGVQAESAGKGQGSTFTVTLPLRAVRLAAATHRSVSM